MQRRDTTMGGIRTDFETARARLYAIFPRLVIEVGLSPSEAMAYGLNRELGYSRTQTAEIMTHLTGNEVLPIAVSRYVQTARVKIDAAALSLLDGA